MGIWNMKKYEAHISDDNSLLSQLVEKKDTIALKKLSKGSIYYKVKYGDIVFSGVILDLF